MTHSTPTGQVRMGCTRLRHDAAHGINESIHRELYTFLQPTIMFIIAPPPACEIRCGEPLTRSYAESRV
jgi:hypothetical protein